MGGFTLIELLVVIAIIGIIASMVLIGLNSTRRLGRDARRIADVRQIQTALELFFNTCGTYPGGVPAGTNLPPECTSVTHPAMMAGVGPWNITTIPKDPLHQWDYGYCSTGGGSNYTLGSQLEDTGNSALQQMAATYPCAPADGPAAGGGGTCSKANGYYCVEL